MIAFRLAGTLRLLPLLGVAAFGQPAANPPPSGTVEREALRAGVYRAPVSGPAAAAPVAPPAGAVSTLTVMPIYVVMPPPDHIYEDVTGAMRRVRWWQPRVLYFRQLRTGLQVSALGLPRLRQVDVPWSPMVTDTPVSLAPDDLLTSSKLQVRFPVINLAW